MVEPLLSDSDYLLALVDPTFKSAYEVRRHHKRMRAIAARLSEPAAPVDALKYIALRAKGVLDADDNLDAWDTPPYDIATRHVEALNERDPSSVWRLAQLYVLADEAAAPVDARDALKAIQNLAQCGGDSVSLLITIDEMCRAALARQAAAPAEGEK